MNHRYFFFPLFICLISLSCDDNRHIRHYRIPKTTITKLESPKSVESTELQWIAHRKWIPTKGSSMRIGSFDVPFSDGTGDLSIIKLDGSAGGLALNINRWRVQLNLNSHTEIVIQKYTQNGESQLGPFLWFTIINPENVETAFLTAIFQTETQTIFVKLSATTDGISELESQFLDFCKSFKLDVNQ